LCSMTYLVHPSVPPLPPPLTEERPLIQACSVTNLDCQLASDLHLPFQTEMTTHPHNRFIMYLSHQGVPPPPLHSDGPPF
jgi:hypothetical protein